MPPRIKPLTVTEMSPNVAPGASIQQPDQVSDVYTVDDMREHGYEMARTALFENVLWYFYQKAQKNDEPPVMINGLASIMEFFGFVKLEKSQENKDAQ